MSTHAGTLADSALPDVTAWGRAVVLREAQALEQLAHSLGTQFSQAVQIMYKCTGSVVVCGVGKAGLIGQKLAATLASTGTPAHFLHAAEAVHGDLGKVRAADVGLFLSYSGETEEVVRLIPVLHGQGVTTVAITGSPASTLAQRCSLALTLGPLEEACPLGLAPTTSTTAMLALGDALAMAVSRLREFRQEDFARLHPGGNLGRRLARVVDWMRPLAQCRLANMQASIRVVLISAGRPGRRTGAIMLLDDEGRLAGLFTDSDLARLLECDRWPAWDQPIAQVMTGSPISVRADALLTEAIELLAQHKISELPIIGADGKPVGLIDVTDLMASLPRTSFPPETTEPGGPSMYPRIYTEGR